MREVVGLKIGCLHIQITGREFEDAECESDSDWLLVTASCEAGGASVRASGPFLRSAELRSFLAGCEQLYGQHQGEAELCCLEPNLEVKLRRVGSLGELEASVRITPDHLFQDHLFRFPLDQSYLPEIMAGLRKALQVYPSTGDQT